MKKSIIFLLFNFIIFSIYGMTGEEILKKSVELSKKENYRGLAEVKFLDSKGKSIKSFLAGNWHYIDEKGLSKDLTTLLKPLSVKGTKMLSVEKNEDETSLWVYLPKSKKVRRMVEADKSKSFMGSSDITNEDRTWIKTNQWNIKKLEDEKIKDGMIDREYDCYKIEITPKKGNGTGYDKEIIFIDKEIMKIIKTNFYINGKIVKKLKYDGWKKTSSGNESYKKYTMKTLKTGTSTVYLVRRIIFGKKANVSPSRFTMKYLKTGRE